MVNRSSKHGQARLYVRMEGLCPFALLIDDDLGTDALERIARRHACGRYGPKVDAKHVLVRRILFAGNDQLMDFAHVKTRQLNRDDNSQKTGTVGTPPRFTGRNFAFVDVLSTYTSSSSCDDIRESCRTKVAHVLDGAVAGTESGVAGETNYAAALIPPSTYISFLGFHRLVLMMTDPRNPQRDLFTRVAFLTYRQFASPEELLDRLLERYEVPPLVTTGGGDRSPLEHQAFAELRLDIRCTVFKVLEYWVKHYYEDFSNDTLYHRLHTWAREKVDRSGAPSGLLQLMLEGDRTPLHMRVPEKIPGIVRKGETPTALLIRYSPLEIAAQITILTSYVHRRLKGPELIGQHWETEKANLVPNFIQYRDFFFQVSNWVSYAVVSERDLERRSQNLAVLMFVCDELVKLRNWDMLVAVYGGLKNPAVERLLHTWAALPGDALELFIRLRELLDSDTGYKALKLMMMKGKRPQFPCIATFFHELRELESGTCSQQGLVNFERCLQQYRLLQFLLLGSEATVDHLLHDYYLMGSFSQWRTLDASVLIELSNEVEKN